VVLKQQDEWRDSLPVRAFADGAGLAVPLDVPEFVQFREMDMRERGFEGVVGTSLRPGPESASNTSKTRPSTYAGTGSLSACRTVGATQAPPITQQDSDTLTQGKVYDLLSNARRRFVISYLRDREEPVELNALSREVAAWESETAIEDLTDQQIKRVYVSLYQTHIPKLNESGLVDYDRDTGMVALADNVRALDTYLPDGDQP
jgi:hypothetical protein